MTDYEQVREAIAKIGASAYFNYWPVIIEEQRDNWRTWAEQVLSLKWADGYPMIGIIAKDQEPPYNPYEPPPDKTQELWSDIVSATQADMRKAGFRKIVPGMLGADGNSS